MEYNEGHLIEGFDRTHIIQTMIDDFLVDHPSIVRAELNDKAKQASQLIFEIYQGLATLEKRND